MHTSCKLIFNVICLLVFISVKAQSLNDTITAEQLKRHIGFLASDSMKGRGNHTPELNQCAYYIASEFEKYGLKQSVLLQSYYQPFIHKSEGQSFDSSTFNKDILLNVVGILPGKSKPDEIIIFSSHYDHVGIDPTLRKDKIHNGANDNASGVAAVLSLANYFSLANSNERTLVFCAFAAEELGLIGSNFFVNSVNLQGVKAVVNIEMIGRPGVGRNSFLLPGQCIQTSHRLLEKIYSGNG